MYKAHLFTVLVTLLLTTVILGIGLFKLKPDDFKKYQQLLASSMKEKKGPLISYSQQKREEVSKEIWFQETNPIHCRLHSRHSALFFFQDEKNKMEVIEELEDVNGLMQEELFYILPDGREAVKKENGKLLVRGADSENIHSWINPTSPGLTPMQSVRYFEAEKASYNYTTQVFFGESVKLWKYRLEGHTPPISLAKETPLMIGTAQSIEFTIKSDELKFTAYQLKATFDPKKGAI